MFEAGEFGILCFVCGARWRIKHTVGGTNEALTQIYSTHKRTHTPIHSHSHKDNRTTILCFLAKIRRNWRHGVYEM